MCMHIETTLVVIAIFYIPHYRYTSSQQCNGSRPDKTRYLVHLTTNQSLVNNKHSVRKCLYKKLIHAVHHYLLVSICALNIFILLSTSSTVVQKALLMAHSSRVSGSILSSEYCFVFVKLASIMVQWITYAKV